MRKLFQVFQGAGQAFYILRACKKRLLARAGLEPATSVLLAPLQLERSVCVCVCAEKENGSSKAVCK